MKLYCLEFKESFNLDLTENTLGFVFFRRFHFGIDFNSDNIQLTFQNGKKINMFILAFKADDRRFGWDYE